MATTPVATTTPTPGFQPAFKRVTQSNDCDCAFACIAMIANKPLADVRQAAIDHFKHPAHGPFWIGEDLIIKLFAHFSWVATFYKEVSTAYSGEAGQRFHAKLDTHSRASWTVGA